MFTTKSKFLQYYRFTDVVFLLLLVGAATCYPRLSTAQEANNPELKRSDLGFWFFTSGGSNQVGERSGMSSEANTLDRSGLAVEYKSFVVSIMRFDTEGSYLVTPNPFSSTGSARSHDKLEGVNVMIGYRFSLKGGTSIVPSVGLSSITADLLDPNGEHGLWGSSRFTKKYSGVPVELSAIFHGQNLGLQFTVFANANGTSSFYGATIGVVAGVFR